MRTRRMGWFARLFRKKPRLRSIALLTSHGRIELDSWSFPAALHVQADVSSARWVEESLRKYDWATVGSLLPEGFEAYARILHPAYRAAGSANPEPVSWAEIAAANNRVMHPLVQFERIANLSDDLNEQPPGLHRPEPGDLPREASQPLLRTLRQFTSTSERCWFCVWNGFGGMELMEGYEDLGLVSTPGREYVLLAGAIDTLELFSSMMILDGPNIWWPEDRAWCVATEIDLDSTYVAGSRECIDLLIHDPDLEAFPASLEDLVHSGSDTINL